MLSLMLISSKDGNKIIGANLVSKSDVVHFLSSVSFVMTWTVKEVSSVLFMSFRKLNQVRDFLPLEKLKSSQ
jgi:hypothetical protein